jgi:hypothetical protein
VGDAALQGLDVNTEPQYFTNSCLFATAGGVLAPAAPGIPPPDAVEADGVTVLARQTVGPFDTATIQGDTAERLVEWLQTNGFRINDTMLPYIQPYVDAQMLFVAVKLIPESDVDAVSPLSLTYVAEEPVIPLGLTSVAAQPEMGVKAFVVGAQRYAPTNYVDLTIPDEMIEFDQFGFRNNYLNVVSREVDRVGGLAFVTEYAQPTTELLAQLQNGFNQTPEAQTASEQLTTILSRHAYMTRLYTRLSAEEMAETGGRDPGFAPADEQTNVSNIHDLSQLTPPDDCFEPPSPNPCDFTYCGRLGLCVTNDANEAACVCADAAIARPTATNPNLAAAVYCEPIALNLDVPLAANEPAGADPCTTFSCGPNGECLVFNENPVCRCEPGAGAIARAGAFDPVTATSAMTVSCEPVAFDINLLPNLPPIGEVEPGPMVAPGVDDPTLAMPPAEPIPPGAGQTPNTPPSSTPTTPVVPDDNAPPTRALSSGGCAISNGQSRGQALACGFIGLAAAWWIRRRRRALRLH